MRDNDCEALFDNVDLPPASLEQREGAIAAALRKGPSKRFCRLLAAMIDGEKNVTQFAMTLRRKQRGQPAKANVEFGKAVEAAIAGKPRGQQKEAMKKFAAKHRVSSRTAESALQAWRLEKGRRLYRETAEAAEQDCVPWPAGLEDEIKREEMPE